MDCFAAFAMTTIQILLRSTKAAAALQTQFLLLLIMIFLTFITNIIKNEKFSHYHYEKKDYVSGLLLAIQACADYEKNHEAVDLLSDEQIKINRGVISEYSDEICNVQLINQVSFGEDMRDYGKECRLYPLDVQGIIKRYSDLLEKHKKLQLEKDVALETEVSVDMLAADKEIMAYLNEHSFCRRNSPETNH